MDALITADIVPNPRPAISRTRAKSPAVSHNSVIVAFPSFRSTLTVAPPTGLVCVMLVTLPYRRVSSTLSEYERRPGLKRCRTCGETKNLDEFYSNILKTGKRSHRPDCKKCMHTRYNQRYRTASLTSKDYSDVVHDYQFSRFIGRSHTKTLEWLEHGYPDIDSDRLRQWKLRQYENTEWTPNG